MANKLTKDFVSEEPRQYHFKMGQVIASSLSGVVAGAAIASIIWYIAIEVLTNGV